MATATVAQTTEQNRKDYYNITTDTVSSNMKNEESFGKFNGYGQNQVAMTSMSTSLQRQQSTPFYLLLELKPSLF